jgi:hypothetical protein
MQCAWDGADIPAQGPDGVPLMQLQGYLVDFIEFPNNLCRTLN